MGKAVMTDVGKTPRIRRVQRTALVLLVLSGVVNYIDRATLAVANPLIREELGLSIGDMGLLLSAFLWAYAFSQLAGRRTGGPARAAADARPSARPLVARPAAGGLVHQFCTVFRRPHGAGLGEAPQFPTAARVSRDWFNPRDRGTATGIWNCSSTLGTAVSVPLLTFLMLYVGWRWMFVIMGVAGVLVAAIAYAVYRDPSEVEAHARRKQAHLTEGDTTGEPAPADLAGMEAALRLPHHLGNATRLLRHDLHPLDLCLMAAGLSADGTAHEHRPVPACSPPVPFAFGVLGSLLGGRLTDLLARHGISPMNSRKWPMSAALAGTGVFTACAALTPSNALAITCISAAMFLCYVSTATGWAMASVAAPANVHGLSRRDAEFRRLSRWRAGADGDRLHRAVLRFLCPRDAAGRRRRAGLRGRLLPDCAGSDPSRGTRGRHRGRRGGIDPARGGRS